MAEAEEIALSSAFGGMNAALNPSNLPHSQYARGTNVQLINQRPTTRRGVRAIPFCNEETDADRCWFQENNFQGGMFYNPSKGQSSVSFARDGARIMCSVGGKRFQLVTKEVSPTLSNVTVEEIGRIQADPELHTVWWYQAENYAIAQDGEADTWIWDSYGDPYLSTGLNIEDKEVSKLANAATVGVYAHARIVQVVNARQVLIGDIIHKDNISSPANILDMTEQLYWATGAYINPPSSMGHVLAAGILPLRDTQHGHGDLMMHCEDGIFSMDINIYPRTSWASTPMVKHVLLETGARGPYALALYDGDQFFRSRHGLQSLRSARGESQLLGNPLNPISEEVETWLANDYQPYVRFTSLAKWAIARRLFMTVAPWVKGRFRGSRGIISLNFAPVASAEVEKAWEGLMTFPPEFKSPIQMINGVFNGRDRTYAICQGADKLNRLVEMTQDLKNDVLEDGSECRISCQLITKMMDGSTLFNKKSHTTGELYLTDVEGVLDWGVWARNEDSKNWTRWRKGQECVKTEPCCADDGECDITDFHPKSFDLNLGSMPKNIKESRKIQFLIRWRGVAAIEGLKIKSSSGDPDSGSGLVAGSDLCDHTEDRLICGNYGDFEYSEDVTDRWED